jgi:tRNA pseudouridine38-40 synthase
LCRDLPTFKLTIAYDGSEYVGWQRQASGVSVQSVLESACAELAGEAVTVRGAGRTDAGVHARGQVASVTIDRAIECQTVVRALNWRLPLSIRVLEAVEVPGNFDPRFDARYKAYRYRIWNSPVLSPFERAYVWHVREPELDVDRMDDAARLIEGTHDFAAFQGTGAATLGTRRTVFSSRVGRDAGSRLIVYDVSGDGFLRHMVRNVIGSLVEIGRGQHPPHWILAVLASGDRQQGGPTAPPHGLFLMEVGYEQPAAPDERR